MTAIKKHLILLIDDNATNLKVAIKYLKSYGFEIMMARNGEIGLERAIDGQPDLILLDVQMPGIDGFETCRRLKAHPETATIPVIFMTVLSDAVDKVKGLELGAVDYITKPLEMGETVARVQTHLALRDLQHRLEERVQERTAALEMEIANRQQQEQEKERLLEVVRHQSEQIRNMTTWLIETQQAERQSLALDLQEAFTQKIALLQSNLTVAQETVAEDSPLVEQVGNALQVVTQLESYVAEIVTNLPKPTAQERNISDNPLIKLSEREREVLQLLAQGKSGQEIADVAGLTIGSVHTYTHRIKAKLDIPDTPGLIKFVLAHKLVD